MVLLNHRTTLKKSSSAMSWSISQIKSLRRAYQLLNWLMNMIIISEAETLIALSTHRLRFKREKMGPWNCLAKRKTAPIKRRRSNKRLVKMTLSPSSKTILSIPKPLSKLLSVLSMFPLQISINFLPNKVEKSPSLLRANLEIGESSCLNQSRMFTRNCSWMNLKYTSACVGTGD